jgi:hypothetical protein
MDHDEELKNIPVSRDAAHDPERCCTRRDLYVHGGGIVKVDEGKGTLTWRGTTFQGLKVVEGCRLTWQATHEGITAELCTATQGGGDLTIGKANFECQLVRQ